MKTENHIKIVLAAILVATVALLGGRAVLAGSDSPANDVLKVALANQLSKYPDSELAKLVAQYLLGEQHSEPVAGLSLTQGDTVPTTWTCSKDSTDQFTSVCEGWDEIDLPSTTDATSTVKEFNFLGNQLNTDVFVDYSEVVLSGTVSSTFSFYAGVTTTPSVNPNAGSGRRPNNLIDGAQFVTSTVNVQSAENYRATRNSVKDAGTAGVNTVRMKTSDYIQLFVQAEQGSGNCFNASACEPVTSTARGWTGKFRYHYHFRKPL